MIACVGRSGGLEFLWKNDVDFNVVSYSPYHIHGEMRTLGENGDRTDWLLTGVYGHPNSSRHKETRDLLWSLRSTDSKPWLALGDFNEILQPSEKKGSRDHMEKQMEDFRDFVFDCAFRDLGYKGFPFTWCNN